MVKHCPFGYGRRSKTSYTIGQPSHFVVSYRCSALAKNGISIQLA